MGNKQNYIELNGKIYDPKTGRPVHETAHKKHVSPVRNRTNPKVVDGFVRRPKKTAPQQHEKHLSKPARNFKPRTTASHNAIGRHAPEHAKTLMRQVVKKPSIETAIPHNTHAPRIDKRSNRLQRAQSIPKSTSISRFTHSSHTTIRKISRPLSVQHPKKHLSTANTPSHQMAVKHNSPSSHKPQSSNSRTEKIVATALRNATAHEASQQLHKKPKKRFGGLLPIYSKRTRLASTALAVLLLGGFFVYQNIPNLSMKIAAQRAGFEARLPGYQPAGFALKGPIQYSPGKISVNFKSNSDERNFHITQQVSNWNSQALVDNFIASNNKQYQTVEQKGKTIYIYDSTNATWVSGGTWYQIEGNSSLSSDQLLSIADSL